MLVFAAGTAIGVAVMKSNLLDGCSLYHAVVPILRMAGTASNGSGGDCLPVQYRRDGRRRWVTTRTADPGGVG